MSKAGACTELKASWCPEDRIICFSLKGQRSLQDAVKMVAKRILGVNTTFWCGGLAYLAVGDSCQPSALRRFSPDSTMPKEKGPWCKRCEACGKRASRNRGRESVNLKTNQKKRILVNAGPRPHAFEICNLV